MYSIQITQTRTSNFCPTSKYKRKMSTEAILVSYQLKRGSPTTEASGILFNENLILITGTIFIPLLHEAEGKNWVTLLVKSSSSKVKKNKHISKVSFRVFKENKENDETIKMKGERLLPLESKIVGVWKCPLVSHSLEKLFYDWTFAHVNNESKVQSSDDIDMSKELMSIFIILKCEGRQKQEQIINSNKIEDDVRELLNSTVEPNRGEDVEIVSTPFGSKLFVNSLSRGVVSIVAGKENSLLLTDARTVSGCEGGPIFVARRSRDGVKSKSLIGVVTCPLTYWRGEWVGLTIGISLMPVLRKLVKSQSVPDTISQNNNSGSILLQLLDETVILVRSEDSWGTGVVLDGKNGIIITCSHVVKNDENISVFFKDKKYPAATIFKSPSDIPYDLAVIEVVGNSPFNNQMTFCNSQAVVGEAVVAAGFPFFSEKDEFNVRPSVVSGCIARVNPFMIQTTCCIQSGFSGGPLLKHGQLLGLIVSNARDTAAGALFPHINFVIPSSVFQTPLRNYIETKNVESLKVLESSNPKVLTLWALQTSKL